MAVASFRNSRQLGAVGGIGRQRGVRERPFHEVAEGRELPCGGTDERLAEVDDSQRAACVEDVLLVEVRVQRHTRAAAQRASDCWSVYLEPRPQSVAVGQRRMDVESCLSQRPERSPRPVQQPGGHRRLLAMQPAVAHTQRPEPADGLRVEQTQERGKSRGCPRMIRHGQRCAIQARRQRVRRSRPILDLPAPLDRPWHACARARQSTHERVLHLIGRTGFWALACDPKREPSLAAVDAPRVAGEPTAQRRQVSLVDA